MVWGAICSTGKCNLYIHDKTVDSTEYIECLEKAFIPMKKDLFGRKKCYLLQDGARSHTSKLTLEWCKSQKINIL